MVHGFWPMVSGALPAAWPPNFVTVLHSGRSGPPSSRLCHGGALTNELVANHGTMLYTISALIAPVCLGCSHGCLSRRSVMRKMPLGSNPRGSTWAHLGSNPRGIPCAQVSLGSPGLKSQGKETQKSVRRRRAHCPFGSVDAAVVVSGGSGCVGASTVDS